MCADLRQIFIKTVVLGICFAKDLREVSEMRFISTTNLKLPLRIYHYGSSWNVTTEGPSQLQVFIRWVVATISYIYIAIVINTGSNLRQLGRVIITGCQTIKRNFILIKIRCCHFISAHRAESNFLRISHP